MLVVFVISADFGVLPSGVLALFPQAVSSTAALTHLMMCRMLSPPSNSVSCRIVFDVTSAECQSLKLGIDLIRTQIDQRKDRLKTLMAPLTELIYTSVPSEYIKEADVKDILTISRKNNSAKDITGLLTYDGRRFMQILEGDMMDVEELFESIMDDPRHGQVELLHTGAIAKRSFKDWKMTFKSVPDGMLAEDSDLIGMMTFFQAEATLVAGPSTFGSRMFSLLMKSAEA